MSDKRVALITGASRGIGAAIAMRLARDGFQVVINHRRSADGAAAVAESIRSDGGVAVIEQADVASLPDARALVERIRSGFGRLDVLVNNAGRAEDGLLLLTSDERWWATFNDNVAAVVQMTRAALPLLLGRRSGVIVNISSVSGIRGTEGQTAYSSAKAAINGFTKALARELATRVSVNCVAPGPIDTEMYRNVPEEKRNARIGLLPMRRLGRSSEVAEVVAMLAGGNSGFVHGQIIAVDGGATI
jgi:3-oxoacyl-[acyl-carrier protein] reductase